MVRSDIVVAFVVVFVVVVVGCHPPAQSVVQCKISPRTQILINVRALAPNIPVSKLKVPLKLEESERLIGWLVG